MTWLPVDAGTEPERDIVFGLKPDPYAELREILRISFRITDPALLDLCRLRLAQLMKARAELADVDERFLTELKAWDRSHMFTGRERAALAFAEQYQIDHHGITNAQKDELVEELSERGIVNFVWALHLNDAYLRALSLLDIAPDSAPTLRPERDARMRDPGPLTDPAAPTDKGQDDTEDLRDPTFLAAYERLSRATVRQSLVDDVTSEAIRLRNAWFQGCRY